MDGTFPFIAASAALVNAVLVTGLQPIMMPRTSDFFEVYSIEAERAGNTAELHVSREIHAPIVMEYSVRVMQDRPDGLAQVCAASGGPFEYQPRAIMPDPVSLEWWTEGACSDLPPGPLQIITTWKPADPDMKPLTVIARLP